MDKSKYTLLVKHFQEQTSTEEEKQIAQFKKENQQEYLVLKNLWFSDAKIGIKDFDSRKAWQKVISKSIIRKSKPIYTFKRVAAMAVLLIVGSLFAYFISQKIGNTSVLLEATTQGIQTDTIILADGTTVWLNRNSKLSYPKKFKGKTREVKLEGEAFFEVTRNPDKPFKVKTKHSIVTVLGTTFNIDTDSLQCAVSVASGKVNVQSAYSNLSVTLLPNFMATVTHSDLLESQITNPNYLSWKTGVFLFEDTPLADVINDLNSYYPKTIFMKTDKPDLLFTAQFNNINEADILEILQLTFNLTIQENTNFYEIR